MKCQKCVARVTGLIEAFSQVEKVSVTLEGKSADLVFNTANPDLEPIVVALNEAGFATEEPQAELPSGTPTDSDAGSTKALRFDIQGMSCASCAATIEKRLQELQVEWETLGVQATLKCRIGISTGYCTVGNFGSEERMEYTIIGRGVNLASRLEAAAPPGGILISNETYALVKGEICCEERPPLHVKGAASPVANYQVVGLFEKVLKSGEVDRVDRTDIRLDVDLPAMSAREREQGTEVSDQGLSRLTEQSE